MRNPVPYWVRGVESLPLPFFFFFLISFVFFFCRRGKKKSGGGGGAGPGLFTWESLPLHFLIYSSSEDFYCNFPNFPSIFLSCFSSSFNESGAGMFAFFACCAAFLLTLVLLADPAC